jgi:glycosyltransferase involved in cell wall biosynthesis
MLSVLIPVYNEAATVGALVERVLAAPLPVDRQVVLIDDASTDDTRAIIDRLKVRPEVVVCRHDRNRGKGAAVVTGLLSATGDWVVIQDADLEYDPADYVALLGPVMRGEADATLGSRYLAGSRHEGRRWSAQRLANRVLTWWSNRMTGLGLTDMETCYKLMGRELAESLGLEQQRFGIEPELVGKLAGRGTRVVEVPIAYRGRRHHEGKKIGWRDGVVAMWCVWRYRAG